VRKAEPEATGRYGLSSVNLAWFHGTRPTRKSRLKHSTKAYAPGVDARQRIVELALHRLWKSSSLPWKRCGASHFEIGSRTTCRTFGGR
jgi:hypothetical protein